MRHEYGEGGGGMANHTVFLGCPSLGAKEERRMLVGTKGEGEGQPFCRQAAKALLMRPQARSDGASRAREPTTRLRRGRRARLDSAGGEGTGEGWAALAPDLGVQEVEGLEKPRNSDEKFGGRVGGGAGSWVRGGKRLEGPEAPVGGRWRQHAVGGGRDAGALPAKGHIPAYFF
ncbi:hypothetical protein ZWY2020_032628 [Hordeum vulgare]|nr:hypothetical protein ZWY2020_032628 [Hordeum vulgare]